jgi:filamentous hemagglutinin family protein
MTGRAGRILCAAALLALGGGAPAQVVLDGRLGPSGPVPLGGNTYAITGALGTQVGANLFHSFRTFNLGTGLVAEFSGSPGTANVVARVTGGSASSIDGTLRSTIAGANLWFINPWGVTFGQNAQLDVSGAFHASTASYLVLGSGPGAGRFDAVNPAASVLTAAAPSAFGFIGTPAPLTVNGATLAVAEGKELSLVGGSLTLTGATLLARGGQINLASAGGAGEIAIGTGVAPAPGAGMALAELRITGGLVTTESPSGSAMDSGPIYIRAGRLTLEDTALHTRIAAASTSTGGGGPIDIAVSGELVMTNSEIDSGVFNSASSADAGDITISAGGPATIGGNSLVRSVSVLGSGASGNIGIAASALTVSGSLVSASTGGAGAAGAVQIDVGDLRLLNGGRVRASTIFDTSSTPATGDGGDITVNAAGLVEISGAGSGLFSTTNSYGNAGAIRVNARDIVVANGGRISSVSTDEYLLSDLLAGTVSAGDAGSIALTASGSIRVVGGSISTSSETSGGGSITIRAADTLALQDGAITTSVHGRFTASNAGSITIDPVFVILQDSAILTTAVVGDGGPVSISTQFFMMSPDSVLDTSSQFGQAGTLAIHSPNENTVPGIEGLPAGYFDPSALLRESCAARAGRAASSFVGAGRGGLPAGPGSLAFSDYALRAPAAAAVSPAPLLAASLTSACAR